MMPNGLKLFIADVIDDATGEQEFWYVTGRAHDSALNRFIRWANHWYSATYSYYFDEADADAMEDFLDRYENITADIYEK